MTQALGKIELPNHLMVLAPAMDKLRKALSEQPLSVSSFIIALEADVAQNEKLFDCLKSDSQSVMRCIVAAASLGLRPGNVHQHFHLIPRKGVCTYVIGVRGLLELARRGGSDVLPPQLVWKGEEFTYDRATGVISHPYVLEDTIDRTNDGNILAAYASYRLKGWQTSQVYLLSRREVEKRKAQSANLRSDGPWAKHYESMAKKTVLRALLNSGLIPLGDIAGHLQKAEADADDAEVIHTAEFTETDQEHFDRLNKDPLPETEEQKETREERDAIQAEGVSG